MEKIPTAQNPRSRTAETLESALRMANLTRVVRTAIKAKAVSTTGTSSSLSTLQPLTSMSVAVTLED